MFIGRPVKSEQIVNKLLRKGDMITLRYVETGESTEYKVDLKVIHINLTPGNHQLHAILGNDLYRIFDDGSVAIYGEDTTKVVRRNGPLQRASSLLANQGTIYFGNDEAPYYTKIETVDASVPVMEGEVLIQKKNGSVWEVIKVTGDGTLLLEQVETGTARMLNITDANQVHAFEGITLC